MPRHFKAAAKIYIFSLLIILAFVPYVNAGANSEVVRAYQNFFETTGAEAQYEQMLNITISQFQQGFGSGLRGAAEKDESATPEEKEQLMQMITQAMDSFLKKLRVKIKKLMPFDELVTNIYIPVYAKHFKIEEINEITSFYKSPVGRKFVSVVPTLIQESMTMVNQKYTLQLQEISGKIAEQEFAKIKEKIRR